MTSARPPPPCACVEVVREPFACVSGAAGCVNVNRGPLVLRDGNPCGCLRVSFELTHLVLQFLCRAIHFQKSTPGTPTDLLRRCSNQYADVVSERNIRLSQAKARDSTRSAPSPVRVFSQVRVELQQRISPVACAGGAGGWGVMVTMREDAMAVAVARAAPVFALRSSCSAVSGTCHGLGY